MKKLDMVPLPACADAMGDGCLTRRAILATLASAALTACSGSTAPTETTITPPDDAGTGDDGGSGDDSGTPVTCPSSSKKAGALTSFPQGTWKTGPGGSYIVGHDTKGLFAFSTTCTHQGCTINDPDPSTGATTCPCHGAGFDGNGAVTQGPARSPLPHFSLTVCNGNVYVDTSKTVTSSTRTPPM